SFGSSANNHLIGELAGLIVATARWPALLQWGASLDGLHPLWEREVLAQFAEDGGNKEQALNYHLFSFEFCLYARQALLTSGRKVSDDANTRLDAAMRFFNDVQVDREPWDYGDSDNAFVTPLFAGPHFVREWLYWMAKLNSPALNYWLDAPPIIGKPPNSGAPLRAEECDDWWLYSESGIAVCESGFWWLRWDLSPLGYLATAAHGHLDALHLSLWWKGVAIVVDPGTGAYYGNKRLRQWLASRGTHNAPRPNNRLEWPERLGPFLWAEHHGKPDVERSFEQLQAAVDLDGVRVTRSIKQTFHPAGWIVSDSCANAETGFSVRWQFAPGARFKHISDRQFELRRDGIAIKINVSGDWAGVFLAEQKGDEVEQSLLTSAATGDLERDYAGTVSPAFKKTEWAPYLKLIARPQPGQPCVFTTTFVASDAS
ncbi:MAG TPA: heparinase II/III family protein, partial [Candidatus Acidoferrum sp.]|nr:heparinase II/III family protein [Candidatus Acidoferrum sp.]